MRNLLRDSIKAISGMRYVHIDGDAVFTLGSIGVEKAMKVLLGCKAVEEEGAWPSKDVLKAWGHDVEELNTRVLAAIDDGLDQATATRYVGQVPWSGVTADSFVGVVRR
ncbi:hypothetical protein ABDK96_16165 [Citricoccus nitrophenolicus]|uniref:Uncharacterized protein n=1 Tax=Citricoccus nitrophenolicus TaxID=863575 RepID=A0ABV0IML3_9MICC